jgi:hypothetical protein
MELTEMMHIMSTRDGIIRMRTAGTEYHWPRTNFSNAIKGVCCSVRVLRVPDFEGDAVFEAYHVVFPVYS